MKNIFSTLLYLILVTAFLGACSRGQKAENAVVEPVVAPQSTTTFAPQSDAAVVIEEDTDMSRANLTPMQSIQDLDKRVAKYNLGQNLTSEQVQENVDLKKQIIRGTFDIRELSRLALDKHWDGIKAEEQSHFVDLMTRLLEKKAIFSKEQLRGDNKLYNIDYLKDVFDVDDKSKSTVYSRMNVPKKKMNIDLTYKLLKKKTGWKIFDVIVDDASLLNNYRFQFDRIIQKGGYADLIKRMEDKLNQIGTE